MHLLCAFCTGLVCLCLIKVTLNSLKISLFQKRKEEWLNISRTELVSNVKRAFSCSPISVQIRSWSEDKRMSVNKQGSGNKKEVIREAVIAWGNSARYFTSAGRTVDSIADFLRDPPSGRTTVSFFHRKLIAQ